MGTHIRNDDLPVDRSPNGLAIRNLVSGATGSTDVYVGQLWLEPGERLMLHTHPVDEVLLFTGGTGELSLGGKTFPIQAGVTVHAPAGEVHGFLNTGGDTLHLFIIFPGNSIPQTDFVEPA